MLTVAHNKQNRIKVWVLSASLALKKLINQLVYKIQVSEFEFENIQNTYSDRNEAIEAIVEHFNQIKVLIV